MTPLITARALKSGLSTTAETVAIDRLVAGDERFGSVWAVVGSVPGSFGEPTAALMFAVFREITPARVVEIGSYLGRSTSFLLLTTRELGIEAHVTAIDPHTGDRQQMERLGATVLPSFGVFEAHMDAIDAGDRLTALVQRSHDAAAEWDEPIDFLFVDGWHSYEAVMEDGHDWLPRLTERGVVFFDDYSRYDDVRRAVDDLATEGAFRLWGTAFGQAVGGTSATPPGGIAQLLRHANGRLLRRLYRVRRGH